MDAGPITQQRDPTEILRRVFGFPEFRGLQEQAVQHVLAGGDALVLMPTGGGKSLCYQIPALCRPGTAIVISPLIALMDDQVAALRQAGIAAGALHSELDPTEARDVTRDLIQGNLDLLYVSPERLLSNGTLDRLTRLPIALIAIDEAHCVSQWGHEFRPEYRLLACLAEHFPNVPRIALTATADPRTRDDILHALNMPDAKVFLASFHRPNLHITAQPKIGETAQLLDFLSRHKGACGIVYCASRAKTERTAERLREKGFSAVTFHAGLAPAEKREGLMRFRSGEAVIMVATIAFGMGIDRPDVRFVVHLDMPDSPEAFYQQIGRAGRDGDPSETFLLYGGEDIARSRHWLMQSAAPEQQKHVMRARLETMISLTETVECRTERLLTCFGENLPEPCGHCDNCAAPPTTYDGTTEAQKILSAVYRTDQIFGALHIIAVLRGEKTEPVLRHHHDRLPVFGIGADHAAPFWRGVIRQLIALGALDIDTAGHGGLYLVANPARPILRGEERVMLRLDSAPRPERRTRTETKRDGHVPSMVQDVPPALFEALRAWRAEQARSQRIPPYVIFHDSVLRDIAATRPSDLDDLGQIKGVGASKLARYGRSVLSVLATSAS
ncbi:MAG: DNA helicase RecQ [Acetobacteraceae bacterium]|nr:DNA helicase RecQ [Acetobacteraceae bacterium]MSP30456.1 DNA helicase RecQ [Acetobacteraceae bacterium]